ncbi:MAG: flagellar hook-associated protein FlgK [Paracoccaceae bacterium]
MSISSALTIALSGLTATGKRAEITSGNLANALTDGYGRQTVDVSSGMLGGIGTGVTVIGAHRASSPELTSARRIADGDLAGRQGQLDALVRLERSLGAIDGEDTLATRVLAFEAALRRLAETPELAPRQAAAAAAASDVAMRLNQISTESARVRQTADAEIARQVSEVNGALTKIARLNRQIQIFASSGRDTASLVDQREQLIDRVASIVPIREQMRPGGVVELTTAQGLVLVDTRAREIAFTPTPVITAPMRYNGGAGALSGLTLNGVDITPGGPGSQAIAGGALAAQFDIRDRIAPEVSDRADALAADLIGRLAAPGLDPTLAPGDPGLFTDDGTAYDPLNLAGLAGRIRLNAAVDPGAGGDPALLRDGLGAAAPGPAANGDLPRALLDALTATASVTAVPGLSPALSFSQAVAGLVELTAFDRVSAEGDVAAFSSTRETLASAEAEVIGVDTDAELQALIQIEQAYAANVQVIQTASRMLDQLMEI